MDRFGGFYELMFRVVMCQIRKSCTSARIHLIDVEVLSFDLGPCTAFAREVLEKANGILFSTRLPSDFRTVRKNNSQGSP
jgi:hypothetical protein